MKVSLLITDLHVNGGAQRQVLFLARWLKTLGHDATVYAYRHSPDGCYPELAAALDIRAVKKVGTNGSGAAGTGRHHSLLCGAKRHLYESWKLARLVRDPGDILNAHVRGATRAAVYCKRRSGAPVVWMCDDARNWEEAGYRTYYSRPVQWVFDQVMRRMEVPIVREIDRIVVLDHHVKRIMEDFYHRPTQVVRSGLDVQAFSEKPEARRKIRERYGILENDFLLLWLGILAPHRRLEDALAAVRLVARERQDVRFLIVGSAAFSPAYARQLQEYVGLHRLNPAVRFHLRGVSEAELADYYSAADALVYLAENQCWSLSVFEAIACNRAVIVSRTCGAHEVLENKKTAMLVPGRDPQALKRAIVELADYPNLHHSLPRNARAEVLEQISWEKYARNMLDIFEEVRQERHANRTAARPEVFA